MVFSVRLVTLFGVEEEEEEEEGRERTYTCTWEIRIPPEKTA